MATSPPKRLNPFAYDALLEALATVYWNRRPFQRFLEHQPSDYPRLLANLPFDGTKREVAEELVRRLSYQEERYQTVTLQLIEQLAGMRAFPNLMDQEHASELVPKAEAAVRQLQQFTHAHTAASAAREHAAEQQAADQVRQAEQRRFSAKLAGLKDQFLRLSASANPQQRGLELETLLNELFLLFDLDPRAAYQLAHEQIDGSFAFDTDYYLLEAKWVKEAIQPPDLHVLKCKIDTKAKGVRGLFIAVNGFTAGAIAAYSHGTPLLLMDGTHLFRVLDEQIALTDLLRRMLRHAETGEPYLPVDQLAL